MIKHVFRWEDEDYLKARMEPWICYGLQEQLEQIVISGNREYNMAWHTTLDLRHLLTVSEAITRAALERNESRGAHFREDYPIKDESLGKLNTILRKGSDGEMLMIKEPITEMPADLNRIIEENQ